MKKSVTQNKFLIVLERNTFFFHNDKFEESYEGYIGSITSLLLLLKDRIEQVETNNQRKDVAVSFIRDNPDGLNALLALSGLSRESLLRLITFIRVVDNPQLKKLVNFSKWGLKEGKFKSEIREDYIVELIKKNKLVAIGITNLFFEGNTLPILRQVLPLFEENNPTGFIRKILDENEI